MDPALVKSLGDKKKDFIALCGGNYGQEYEESLKIFLHSTIVVNGIVKLDSKAVVLSNSEDSSLKRLKMP